MREDQRVRLAELSEKLAEVVLKEADPEQWPGAGIPLARMSKEDRGNRYWSKKNAAATFSLLERAIGLAEKTGAQAEQGVDIDMEITRYEKQAAKLLDRVTGAARKTTSDMRHGKAAG